MFPDSLHASRTLEIKFAACVRVDKRLTVFRYRTREAEQRHPLTSSAFLVAQEGGEGHREPVIPLVDAIKA